MELSALESLNGDWAGAQDVLNWLLGKVALLTALLSSRSDLCDKSQGGRKLYFSQTIDRNEAMEEVSKS